MAKDHAIGLIETRGVVALAAGIEAMIKTADVQCIAVERIGSGYLAAAVQGSLAPVRQAVEAATVAVKQYGELRAAQVYPKPHDTSAGLLEGNSSRRLRQAITAASGEGTS
ncbi:MAG: BMC domain-containing protein [Pseudonocardiaceae bacterium]|nr:BMC domain-containing protein [Pseudonocardiaceae bacterium]